MTLCSSCLPYLACVLYELSGYGSSASSYRTCCVEYPLWYLVFGLCVALARCDFAVATLCSATPVSYVHFYAFGDVASRFLSPFARRLRLDIYRCSVGGLWLVVSANEGGIIHQSDRRFDHCDHWAYIYADDLVYCSISPYN